MTLQFPKNAAPFVASSGSVLEAYGIEITIDSDFHVYADILAEERPNQKLGDPFNPKLHDFDEKNGFWLIGRNEAGDLIHTQAFKTIDLADVALSTYLMR